MKKKNEIRTKQSKTKDEPKAENTFRASGKGVFMMRGKGQSFEDFTKAVVEAFRKKGMLTERPKITGGDGTSAEKALVVNAVSTQEGVSAENEYIESICDKWDTCCLINKCYRKKSEWRERCLIKDVTEAG